MQIRYLEAMQAMAKSANSKVIFLPGEPKTSQTTPRTASLTVQTAQNQTVQSALAQADAVGEGPSSHGANSSNNALGVQSSAAQEYGGNNHGFQSAINSHVIENM